MTEAHGGRGSGGEGERIPRRDEVMEALCDAYARDELELEELEARLDRATRAATSGELMDLLQGLDVRRLPVALGGRAAGGSPAPAEEGGTLQVPPGGGRVSPSRVPERQFEMALFSGRERKGSWVPARRITAVALLGGVDLDFREAMFGTGVTEVNAVAFLGGVAIVVPPGVHVDTSGFAVLGGFEEDSEVEGAAPADAPTIRVRGVACLGSVEISVRHPGESARDARRRRKRERKKRLGRG